MATTSARKLIVEVVDARNLSPKDGHGSSSPYVVVDFYGQRRRTRTTIRDLNPAWNQLLEFNVGKPSDVFGDMLELDVLHDKNIGPTTRNNFLGRVRLSSTQFVKKGEEALIYYPLGKKNWYNWIQGDIGLKIYFVDELIPPPPPPPPPPEEEVKRAESSVTPPPPEAAASADMPAEAEPAAPPAPLRSPDHQADPEAGKAQDSTRADEKPDDVEPPAEGAVPPSLPPPVEEESLTTPVPEPTQSEPVIPQTGAADPLRASRSMPEMKISSTPMGIVGPRPIPRASSVSSFTTDVSDRFPMEQSSFDLVEKMHYLFVRVVKARALHTSGNPLVKIVVSGRHVISKPARKGMFLEWDQTFAFAREPHDDSTSSILEVSVWDPPSSMSAPPDDVAGLDFLGGICFDASEIPLRDPPDSPLAPQWYRLEGGRDGVRHSADLMLATWAGTQADDSFHDAWKTDTAGNPSSRSKIYQSPKLWYLRVTVIGVQDLISSSRKEQESSLSSFQVKAQLGFQVHKTKPSELVPNGAIPSWNINEDLIFVATEPFTDNAGPLLFFLVEHRPDRKETIVVGVASIPLASIERRVDDRNVTSRWFSLEDPNDQEKRVYRGRVQMKVFFDGGYHVIDEAAHMCSDYRPTAKQLWKPPVGAIELGIVGCKNLLPMKNNVIGFKGTSTTTTDAYVVVKYGNKWVRTRTISDNLDPKWNEQYTWRVYDPSTVLTIGVFDSSFGESGDKAMQKPADCRIGKAFIRISTLEIGKVYRNTYPLMLLSPIGLKKMGELEVAVRFLRLAPTLDLLHMYAQPLLPAMHHIKPIGMVQQEVLRNVAVKITAAHLARSEPPLPRDVVSYMLDADSHSFSMRKVRANWLRIINIVAGIIDIIKWVDDTRAWKNPTSTVLVHGLMVMLVWFPDLIIPTLLFYVFVVGAWNYRFRSRALLPHFDPKISLADSVDRNELDEEFDVMPCSRPNELVRARYDRLRMVGARVQDMLGDIATQGERIQALVTWKDPRATGIFVGLCFIVAVILYLVPSKMVAMTFGFYYFRHPIFRDRMPSPMLNFFRRLPSLSDRIL